MNEQAVELAASVLAQPVVAATRCEQATLDMAAQAAGVRAIDRGVMRGMLAMNSASSVGRMSNALRTAGLPNSFVLAVTATHVYAIEDKHENGNLVAGKVLKSWDRDGFQARRGNALVNPGLGIPEDRQVLVLVLPLEGGHNRYLKAQAQNLAQVGGKPYRFVVGVDAASERVVDALVSPSAVPNVMIGGATVEEFVARARGNAPSAADPVERLGRLAELHDRGVLTDQEFADQKARILAAG
jgi:hypothetical protein